MVIGKKTKYADSVFKYVRENNMSEHVLHRQNIDLNDLAGVYQNASMFAYPSVFEGFGIPIIEALFSKVPVITSTGSCFSESGGPASIYVDPYNVPQMSAAISAIWEDAAKKEEMVEGKIPGAENIDIKQDEFWLKFKALSKEKKYFVYSSDGGLSTSAARVMKQMGFQNVYNLLGGFEAWKSAGYFVE